jgi:hypothetical protein
MERCVSSRECLVEVESVVTNKERNMYRMLILFTKLRRINRERLSWIDSVSPHKRWNAVRDRLRYVPTGSFLGVR